MQTSDFEIIEYSDSYKDQVLNVWEKSVLATHGFLKQDDFIEIKVLVHSIDFNDFQVFCLLNENRVLGFIGVAEKKVEMLFIDPAYIGQGFGKKLLNFAIHELNANLVDVNEQNTNALKFYQKFGFEIFEKTDRDEQGREYPLLRMRLIGT
ncbi:GNAT family N-acetyltransferase [Sphingobacterium endophyticum]|uniref:GNAT family N-acetyltransferase n=1 Tax=Sphingobacterium endophyticum TaxID=2546448 RepID=UPI0012E11814|nr:GNAT family N-acetyltransferase [Sphingobacterium endophyticum]